MEEPCDPTPVERHSTSPSHRRSRSQSSTSSASAGSDNGRRKSRQHRHRHHRRHHGDDDRHHSSGRHHRHRRHHHRHRRHSVSRSPSPLISRAYGSHINHGSPDRNIRRRMDLERKYEQFHRQVQETAAGSSSHGSVPKYYNPATVDPSKYAKQEEKKKMLWSKAAENSKKTSNTWMEGISAVSGDQTKFCKLMGIKDAVTSVTSSQVNSVTQSQAELFRRLDEDYTKARQSAHTQRGIGLGYSTTLTLPVSSSTSQPSTSLTFSSKNS